MQRQEQEQEKFLNNIAYRLGRARMSDITSPNWDTHPWDHLYQDFDQEQFIQQFISNIQALNAHVHRVKEDEVTSTLLRIIQQVNGKKVLMWDDPRLQDLGIEEYLKNKVEFKTWRNTDNRDELVFYAEQANIGITHTELGLSETGTIVLFNGGGRGRSVSLLPEIHIAILQTSAIVPRLTQALQKISDTLKGSKELPSLINFISGPSRTSDIEMILTVGVHGPKEMYLILVD